MYSTAVIWWFPTTQGVQWEFGPVVEVDRMMKEAIRDNEVKEPFIPLPGTLMSGMIQRGVIEDQGRT